MPNMTLDLPNKLYEHLCEIAETEGAAPEIMVRQTITLSMGFNPSSPEKPISTGFLKRQTEDVLSIATREPVFLAGPDGRGFAMVSYEAFEEFQT